VKNRLRNCGQRERRGASKISAAKARGKARKLEASTAFPQVFDA